MEIDIDGTVIFPIFLKHKNLEVLKIVLELEHHPINENNVICSDLRFDLTDYKRLNFFYFLLNFLSKFQFFNR
jgi:hypothetical protein